MIKPNVFNYQKYLDALEEIDRLKRANANLQIHCRILEDDLKNIRINNPPDAKEGNSGDA